MHEERNFPMSGRRPDPPHRRHNDEPSFSLDELTSAAGVTVRTVRYYIAEGDRVVGRFACSATHLGDWLGYPPTGRRFERIAEVYIFRLREGRIVHAWGLEDTLGRLEQLGLR